MGAQIDDRGPISESHEAGTIELITSKEWKRRMDGAGGSPKWYALTQAQWAEICVEVEGGQDIELS